MKTLNDLKVYKLDDIDCIDKDELRQEAIKWYKHESFNQPLVGVGARAFIRTFFELTEEELNDEKRKS